MDLQQKQYHLARSLPESRVMVWPADTKQKVTCSGTDSSLRG
jgi:hypothetical protein